MTNNQYKDYINAFNRWEKIPYDARIRVARMFDIDKPKRDIGQTCWANTWGEIFLTAKQVLDLKINENENV